MWACARDRARSLPLALTVGLGVAGLLAAAAAAAFDAATAPASQIVSSTSLVAPTGLTASCVALTSNVNLTWTPTPSAAASAYAILRSTTTGGPYTQIGTVSGRTTTTFTDTIGLLQTQNYVVEATRNNWTSALSNQSGVRSTGVGICQSV